MNREIAGDLIFGFAIGGCLGGFCFGFWGFLTFGLFGAFIGVTNG